MYAWPRAVTMYKPWDRGALRYKRPVAFPSNNQITNLIRRLALILKTEILKTSWIKLATNIPFSELWILMWTNIWHRKWRRKLQWSGRYLRPTVESMESVDKKLPPRVNYIRPKQSSWNVLYLKLSGTRGKLHSLSVWDHPGNSPHLCFKWDLIIRIITVIIEG